MIEPKIGSIVLFVLDDKTAELGLGNNRECSPIVPAVIVRVWSNGVCNLKVLTDGHSDQWVTSAHYSEDKEPRSWHYAEMWP